MTAFARVATALALASIGALAIGPLAIGSLTIRSLRMKQGVIECVRIDELEVQRLKIREADGGNAGGA